MKPFRIACWPWVKENPYQRLFYEALAPTNVEVIQRCEIDDAWLRRNAERLDAVHLHWPEDFWRVRGDGRLNRLRGVVGLQRFLGLAGRLGLKRIWTMHNLEHHEQSTWIDRLGYRALARNCELLICHSDEAAAAVARRDRPRGRVVTMPHGNYAGVYPDPAPRDEVRRKLGLPLETPLVCCVGNLRTYKGYDLAVEAVAKLGERVQLLVAGAPHPEFPIAAFQRRVDELDNVALLPESLDDQQWSDVVAASDVVLLPYRKITGSGVLLAAVSLGRGVVATDLPYFREACRPEPAAAAFFAPDDADDLAAVLSRFLETPATSRDAAAARLSSHYDWDRVIEPVAQAVTQWTGASLTTAPAGV